MDQATTSTPASSGSWRINLASTSPSWQYTAMPYPRVMGDAILLPDGTVFLTNGGGVGAFLEEAFAVWHLSARSHLQGHLIYTCAESMWF